MPTYVVWHARTHIHKVVGLVAVTQISITARHIARLYKNILPYIWHAVILMYYSKRWAIEDLIIGPKI